MPYTHALPPRTMPQHTRPKKIAKHNACLLERFVSDPAVQPCAVQDTYTHVTEYQAAMIHNLLADYSAWWRQARGAGEQRFALHLPASIQGQTLRLTGFPTGDGNGLQWHLLEVTPPKHAAVFCVVVGHDGKQTAGTVWGAVPWEQNPEAISPRSVVRAVDFGFIGSYLQQCAALMNLAATPVLAGVLDPSMRGAGTYGDYTPDDGGAVAYNSSQTACIAGLEHNIEVVQGPPGTGKSTTILGIIEGRLGHAKLIGVVCSRNGAVDSIIEKLGGLQVENRTYVLAVGNRTRIGANAARFTLAEQVEHHPTVQIHYGKLQGVLGAMASIQMHLDGLRQAPRILQAGARLYGSDFARRWAAHIDALYAVRLDFLRCLQRKADAQQRALSALRVKIAAKIVRKTRVCVSTIAAVDRWPVHGAHTFIVDEAGCTTEQEMAVLIARSPANLVLIGDDRQLPPFTNVDARVGGQTKHNRSLFERIATVVGRRRVHFLALQYRMHPEICAVVSQLFYEGKLQSAPSARQLRAQRRVANVHPVVFVPVAGVAVAGNGTSVYNTAEVDAVVRVVQRLQRAAVPGSIGVVTFYRAQYGKLQAALQRAGLGPAGVALRTVDSVQGLEYDYVVVSTVRTQPTAFLMDAQRVNVAISRARRGVVVVGHRGMLSKARLWKKIVPRARAMTPAEICA